MSKIGSKKLTRPQVIQANDLMKEHLRKVEDDLWEYEKGWSDQRITQEIGATTPTGVGGLRLECFGKIRSPAPPSNDARIAELETVVTNLVKQLQALALKHDRLCDNLSANRVLDVRYLKTTVKENGHDRHAD